MLGTTISPAWLVLACCRRLPAILALNGASVARDSVGDCVLGDALGDSIVDDSVGECVVGDSVGAFICL